MLVEECFAAHDSGFVHALRQVNSGRWLAAFADRWKQDTRPWARAQLFAYLDQPLSCPGHQPLVKRLFKHAEATRDHELMAAFATAFDGMVRRVRRRRWRWDYDLRTGVDEEVLATPRNVIKSSKESVNPRTGQPVALQFRVPRHGLLFSFRTRFYLRRRAWRYFRRIGFATPEAYPAAIASALRRYRDENLASGENILDSWVLLNACFFDHHIFRFNAAHVALRDEHSLAEMKPAPRFPETWKRPESAPILLNLIAGARSHVVRTWAIQLFRQSHLGGAQTLDVETLFALLNHEDAAVQQFGAELFSRAEGLGREPMTFWLRLLQTRNVTALGTLTEAFKKHVSAERLDLGQCIELACAEAVPVARLGQHFLSSREFRTAEERTAIAALAQARCPVVAGELARLALRCLGTHENYRIDTVSRFFDSLIRETRAAAWEWLIAPDSAGYNDSALWSRLSETPFDDLKLRLIDHLTLRAKQPAVLSTDLTPLWSAVLLGVHRGGRQKAKAVQQIGAAIVADPSRLHALLPVLAVAVRSVRLPEVRAGLAAVVGAVEARPELAGEVRRYLPELDLRLGESAA